MALYWEARAGCCPFTLACGGPQATLFSTTLRRSLCSDVPAALSSWTGSFASWSDGEGEPTVLPPSLQQATSGWRSERS